MEGACCEAGVSMAKRGEAEIKRRKTILPVFIVEDHNDALIYLYRALGSKRLPFCDGAMVHFDSHPDMMIPKNFNPEKIYDKEYVLSSLSIENWIMPAVYAKHFNSLAWIKPPWASQLCEGIHSFKIGHHQASKDIKVSCSQSYFVSELLWSPPEELENTTDVNLEVCTLGCIEDSFASSSATGDKSDLGLGNKASHSSEVLESRHQLSETFRQKLSTTPYVLDIDLDFYSTRNPFLSLFTKQQFEILRNLYHYKHPESGSVEELRAATQRRQEQLSELEFILMRLKEGGSLEDLPRTPRLVSLEPLLSTFPGGRPPDPGLLNDAGCTCDDCDLPHHVSTEEQIRHLVAVTKDFLSSIPTPAVITIARSSRDDYCPPENVDFIQEVVLKLLEELYGALDITKDYELNIEEEEETPAPDIQIHIASESQPSMPSTSQAS